MDKNLISMAILIILSIATSNAQSVHFCKKYTSSGKPIEESSKWLVKYVGSDYFYILYKQSENFSKKKFYIQIERYHAEQRELLRTEPAQYKFYRSYVAKADKSKNWFAHKHVIYDDGIFLVTIIDSEKKEIAKATVKISHQIGNR